MNVKLKCISSVLAGLLLGLACLPVVVLGADITPGYSFVSGEANVTHTKLNNAAAGTINTTFYSGKSSAGTDPNTAFQFLLRDTVNNVFKRTTLAEAVHDHTALLNSRTEKTTPVAGDYFLIADSAAGNAYKKVSATNLATLFATYVQLFEPQIVVGVATNGYTNNAASAWVDVTNITATITPRSASSRFLLRASLNIDVDGQPAHFRFMRDSTPIALGGPSLGGLSPQATKTVGDMDTTELTMEWLDAPATASAITYKVQLLQSGAALVYFNRDNASAPGTNTAQGVSTLVVQEVLR
jgi:hypothetical protein